MSLANYILTYTKDWRNAADFSTYETKEAKVREDMQLLFNEMKDAFNRFVADLSAGLIPFSSSEAVPEDNVQAAIMNVQQQVADLIIGELTIPNRSLAADKLIQYTLTSEELADDCVDSRVLASKAVKTANVDDLAITSAKLAANSVTAGKLGEYCVVENNLASNSVTGPKIKDKAVVTLKLDDGAVTAVKLASNAVETAKIKDANVTAAKLALDSVVTEKIKDANVTAAKLASNAVETAKIKTGAVTAVKLASSAVETAKIKDANVTAAKLATDAVVTEKIMDANVTAAKLATDAVETAKIKDANVTAAKIKDANVTAAKLASNAVSTVYSGTLAAASWSGSSAPFTQAVTLSGVLAADEPIIDLVPSSTYATALAEDEGWGKIYRAVTSANKITFYAKEKPTLALNFKARCIRK